MVEGGFGGGGGGLAEVSVMTLPPQAEMRRARIMGEIRSITALVWTRFTRFNTMNKILSCKSCYILGILLPNARIDYFSSSGDHNLAIRTPLDPNFTAFHRHAHIALGLFVNHRGDRAGAGACSRSSCFADATLPNAQLDEISLHRPHENNIRSIRKLRMHLDCLPDLAPVQRLKLVHEDTAVRIAHLHRSHG